MANPTLLVNDPNEVLLGGNNFEQKTILSGQNVSKNDVLGAVQIAAGTATKDGGNTGDGTVTALALAAGGLAKIGSYILKCIDALINDTVAVGSVTGPTGTGNGTVTALAVDPIGAPAVEGTWTLTCIDESINDAIATGSVTGPTGTGNGTLTELAPDSLGAPAKKGTWILTCVETITNGGRFQLADPDGIIVASDILIAAGAGGVIVFVGAGLTFKITDGGTDFVETDYFSFPVTGSHGGRFKLTDPNGLVVNDRIDVASGAGGTIVYTGNGLTFTITDGSTDFENDDFFTWPVTASHGGRFSLTDPDGLVVASQIDIAAGAGGVIVYTGNGLTFTITDGSTDFEDDDFFTITVTAGSGKLKICVSTSVDGSELARYISPVAVDASLSDLVSRVIKSGDVRQSLLGFGGSDDIDTVVHGQSHKENLRDYGIYTENDVVNDRVEP